MAEIESTGARPDAAEISKVGQITAEGWAAALAHPVGGKLLNPAECPFPEVVKQTEKPKEGQRVEE